MTKQILSVRPAKTGQTENPSVRPVFAYPGPARFFFAFPEIRGHRRPAAPTPALGWGLPHHLPFHTRVAWPPSPSASQLWPLVSRFLRIP